MIKIWKSLSATNPNEKVAERPPCQNTYGKSGVSLLTQFSSCSSKAGTVAGSFSPLLLLPLLQFAVLEQGLSTAPFSPLLLVPLLQQL